VTYGGHGEGKCKVRLGVLEYWLWRVLSSLQYLNILGV